MLPSLGGVFLFSDAFWAGALLTSTGGGVDAGVDAEDTGAEEDEAGVDAEDTGADGDEAGGLGDCWATTGADAAPAAGTVTASGRICMAK